MASDRYHGFLTPRERGVVTLPRALREKLRVDEEGAQIEVTEVGDGVFELRPVVRVPAHQQWFWADRWQAMEREADADIAAGRVEHFDDIDAFLNDLDR